MDHCYGSRRPAQNDSDQPGIAVAVALGHRASGDRADQDQTRKQPLTHLRIWRMWTHPCICRLTAFRSPPRSDINQPSTTFADTAPTPPRNQARIPSGPLRTRPRRSFSEGGRAPPPLSPLFQTLEASCTDSSRPWNILARSRSLADREGRFCLSGMGNSQVCCPYRSKTRI